MSHQSFLNGNIKWQVKLNYNKRTVENILINILFIASIFFYERRPTFLILLRSYSFLAHLFPKWERQR
jgi:hypothetical protein